MFVASLTCPSSADLIEKRKELGYVSVSEFVKEAIRKRVGEIESKELTGNEEV